MKSHLPRRSFVKRSALAAGVFAGTAYAFSMNGLLLVGLAVGLAMYAVVLWATSALGPGEREILRPLVSRRA